MKVIVTCGPSFEPIDEVRRLTNFSTGQLGVLLANRLAHAGQEVICCKGTGATCGERLEGPQLVPFSTNDDLSAALRTLAEEQEIGAVFHAAALCDFRVKQIANESGAPVGGAKIASRAGELTLTLEPAVKVLGSLRALFPQARIAGWKYELEGSRDDALAKGWRQLEENGTDACVVNGRAYGTGFGVLQIREPLHHVASKAELCDWFADWLG
jgi:phosphopantothenoylcysteine decarboxylase/phosphopantothenate--cysteine ligase